MAHNEQEKEQNMMPGSLTAFDVNADDETEDEEVKRNCYGMKYYSTSSSSENDVDGNDDETESEQSSSEESCFEKNRGYDDASRDQYDESSTISTYPDSGDSSSEEGLGRSSRQQPQKFRFDLRDCEPGVTIFRPKPISFLKLQEFQKDNHDDENSSLSSGTDMEADDEEEVSDESIIEDEESESGGLECDEEEEEQDDDDDDDDECSTLSSGSHYVEHDAQAVTCTMLDDESPTGSENENSSDDESTDTETSSDNESLEEAEDEDVKSVLSSNSSDDQVDDHDVDELRQEHPNNDVEFKIEWGTSLSNDGNESDSETSLLVNITLSGSTTESEDSSISVDELEGIMEKIQSSDEMSTLFAGEDDSNNCSSTPVEETYESGSDTSFEQMQDTTDQEPALGKKRRLGAGDQECYFNNKRRRLEVGDTLSIQQSLSSSTSTISNDSPHLLEVAFLKKEAVEKLPPSNRVNSQLAEEELLYSASTDECNSNPIPLLTPPATPVIKSDESVVQMCEWPCNLTVDNALTSAIQLRALSPSSLVKLEETVHHEESFPTSAQEDVKLAAKYCRDININIIAR